MFSIACRQRAANQRPIVFREGLSLSDVNSAWDRLERAEAARYLALREEQARCVQLLLSHLHSHSEH